MFLLVSRSPEIKFPHAFDVLRVIARRYSSGSASIRNLGRYEEKKNPSGQAMLLMCKIIAILLREKIYDIGVSTAATPSARSPGK